MKVVSLDQSATLRISDVETPLSLAAEAAADPVELNVLYEYKYLYQQLQEHI